MSAASLFERGKAIRGGVPLVFPWFGPRQGHPGAPSHGFARTARWNLDSIETRSSVTAITMSLMADDDTRALWPHDFAARFAVAFGETLRMSMIIDNTGHDSFTFENALHTYFTVGDCREVNITGLAGGRYIDKVDRAAVKTQGDEPIVFRGETDRVYLDTQSTCIIHDEGLKRRIHIDKEGSRSTVVWNPWIEKAARMADFGDEQWQHMVCVETANAAQDAVTLAPGQSHTLSATLRIESL